MEAAIARLTQSVEKLKSIAVQHAADLAAARAEIADLKKTVDAAAPNEASVNQLADAVDATVTSLTPPSA